MSIEYTHREKDVTLYDFIEKTGQKKWFSKSSPIFYHGIEYDGILGVATVELERVQHKGLEWVPLCMIVDPKVFRKEILRKYSKKVIHSSRIISTYKIGHQLFEVEDISGGAFTITPSDNTIALKHMSEWLDPYNRIQKTEHKNAEGNSLFRWHFSREDWYSGILQKQAQEAIEEL